MEQSLRQYTLALKSYQVIRLPSKASVVHARLDFNVIALFLLVPEGHYEREKHFEIMASGEHCDDDSADKSLPSLDRTFVAAIEDRRAQEIWMLFELNRAPSAAAKSYSRQVDRRRALPWIDEDEQCDRLADYVRSPFTDDQIARLRVHQKSRPSQLYTCCSKTMIVEQRGLVCSVCGRVQTWALPETVNRVTIPNGRPAMRPPAPRRRTPVNGGTTEGPASSRGVS